MSSNQVLRVPLRDDKDDRKRFLRCLWVKGIGYTVDIVILPASNIPSTSVLEEKTYHCLSSALRHCTLIMKCEESGIRWEERQRVTKQTPVH